MQLNEWRNFQNTQKVKRNKKPRIEMISARLEAMGIEPTGIFNEDLQTLRKAKTEHGRKKQRSLSL